jgi:hypothetical protein
VQSERLIDPQLLSILKQMPFLETSAETIPAMREAMSTWNLTAPEATDVLHEEHLVEASDGRRIRIRQRLPQAPEYHVVPGAGHYDFLPSCSARLAAANPLFCADPSGFKRATFHEEFNGDIVQFFRRTLNVPQKSR